MVHGLCSNPRSEIKKSGSGMLDDLEIKGHACMPLPSNSGIKLSSATSSS